MLREALIHWLTPCPAPLRRLGYLHDLIAVEARGRRCRAAWRPHLEATRAQVRAAVAAAPGRDLCVVVGAGLLLDVPLGDLAAAFRRVVLVDVCWLRASRRQAARFPNVTLVSRDVTGTAAACLEATAVPPVPPADIPHAAEADLLLSLNCLSQLPLNPRHALEPLPEATPEVLDMFCRAIIAAHVEALAAVPGLALLVTDVAAERVLVRDGQALAEDLLFGHPPPQGGDSWWWDLAPAPEEDRRWSLRHRVVAGRIGAGAAATPTPPPAGPERPA